MTEYISREAAVDAGYLSDWYIASVGDESPVWTDAHIDELLNDFIVIPKDTPSADIQPVDRWISVEDSLPEENVSVLIYTITGARSVATRFDNRFFVGLTASFVKEDVTHWQPLPEPPKPTE